MTVQITLAQLKRMKACPDQLVLFERVFGDSVEVTAENLKIAHKHGLSVDWLADNPNTPPEVLATLATDSTVSVRHCVAYNPSTPPEVLAILATDEDKHARCCVAYNRSTPPEVLATLATDEDWRVRRYVADNPNTPPEALAILATDKEYFVRRYVVDQESLRWSEIDRLEDKALGMFTGGMLLSISEDALSKEVGALPVVDPGEVEEFLDSIDLTRVDSKRSASSS